MTYSTARGNAHDNGDCWAPTCPLCELEGGTCDGCGFVDDDLIECDHRALCPDCVAESKCRECRQAAADECGAKW